MQNINPLRHKKISPEELRECFNLAPEAEEIVAEAERCGVFLRAYYVNSLRGILIKHLELYSEE